MIKINNKEYKCINFQYHKTGTVEHLSIIIEGELPSENKLHIKYCVFDIMVVKTLPRVNGNNTHFLAYVLQEGDSEG